MDQNTAKWHEWRRQGIGSSDAPVIMKVSPYKTPYQLWEEKLGLADYSGGNEYVKQKGHEYETRARNLYCLETGIEVEPMLVQFEDFPVLRASLDGYSAEKRIITEFKYVGEESFDSDEIVEHHIPQLQHQLMCTDAVELHYVRYSEKRDRIKIRVVKPDVIYIDSLMREEFEFWSMVQKQTPPEYMDRDFVSSEDKDLAALVAKWREAKATLDLAEKAEREIKEAILANELFSKHKRVSCNDVRIYKVLRKGNIDYTKIPALQDMDLEPYRKKPSEYWTFKKH